ncbi:hypothetical protein DPMN_048255 [Dreissena polymorpha]|uniref:Uncharacterized protein n=1 Tax=Dreissena polymorpha TaxID=45954 RepID=A0A9D4DAW5_DREPO|nr:hypothetical protein DPMN_048255 [Dreissena polymorpha]
MSMTNDRTTPTIDISAARHGWGASRLTVDTRCASRLSVVSRCETPLNRASPTISTKRGSKFFTEVHTDKRTSEAYKHFSEVASLGQHQLKLVGHSRHLQEKARARRRAQSRQGRMKSIVQATTAARRFKYSHLSVII